MNNTKDGVEIFIEDYARNMDIMEYNVNKLDFLARACNECVGKYQDLLNELGRIYKEQKALCDSLNDLEKKEV